MKLSSLARSLLATLSVCAMSLSTFAQPIPTPWDSENPANRAETRQYLSLIWQAEITGQQIDLSQFVFTNDLPEIMGLLVAPQMEVFEKLYSHRLDPHGLSGPPYGLNELMRDDPAVRAQFRECVLTDKITLGPDADQQAADKHLLMIIDGIFEQSEFKIEGFQIVGDQLESTKLEVIKIPGTVSPPTNPPTSPTQFECDLKWWVERSFFQCMTNGSPRLYIPENGLDTTDPNWQKKRRPVPRFDCDDFSDAMIQWLKRRLEEIYGPGTIKFENLIFGWECPDNTTTPPTWKQTGHAMPLVERDGKFYLIDPYTGETYGPFTTREEAFKKALDLFMRCTGGRPLGLPRYTNPDYWPPGYRPEWEPKPWWTDREMQKHFCERLAACCGSAIPTPPNCPPSTAPGGTAPSVLTSCNFRDYMPPGTFIDPGANCDR